MSFSVRSFFFQESYVRFFRKKVMLFSPGTGHHETADPTGFEFGRYKKKMSIMKYWMVPDGNILLD